MTNKNVSVRESVILDLVDFRVEAHYFTVTWGNNVYVAFFDLIPESGFEGVCRLGFNDVVR